MAVWYYYYSYTLMHYASFLGKLSIVNNLTGLDLTLLVIHSFIPFLVSSLVFSCLPSLSKGNGRV